ncbi:MAG: ferritin-like domain-containing protein [Pyrinomonadaceae bacterium]
MSYTSEKLKDFIAKRASRRRFMGQAGVASLGALSLSHLAGINQSANAAQATNPEITDFNILNFALNLEYLEAEYYLRAVGRQLDPSDTTGVGTRGGVTGGTPVPFANDIIRQYAEEIADDEEAHVKFLRSALGSAKVARPSINLSSSFTNAAIAAKVIAPGQTFNPFADEESFLLGAFIFEDVGVTAYKGAARFIQNKDYLEAAAGLLAVEAYHAGEIRTLLLARGLSDPAGKISDLRDAADGAGDLDQGIVDQNGRANIVPTDANGLAFSRNTNQVLSIVYLGGRSGGFGFFPRRLNGAIR